MEWTDQDRKNLASIAGSLGEIEHSMASIAESLLVNEVNGVHYNALLTALFDAMSTRGIQIARMLGLIGGGR